MPRAAKSDEQIHTMQALTQKAAAWLLGYKAPQPLANRADLPRNGDGTYDARALLDAVRESKPDPVREAAVRREAAQADLAEMKRDAAAGRLVEAAAIEAQLRVLAGQLRKLGEAIGRRKTIAGGEVQRRLNEVIGNCEWKH